MLPVQLAEQDVCVHPINAVGELNLIDRDHDESILYRIGRWTLLLHVLMGIEAQPLRGLIKVNVNLYNLDIHFKLNNNDVLPIADLDPHPTSCKKCTVAFFLTPFLLKVH